MRWLPYLAGYCDTPASAPRVSIHTHVPACLPTYIHPYLPTYIHTSEATEVGGAGTYAAIVAGRREDPEAADELVAHGAVLGLGARSKLPPPMLGPEPKPLRPLEGTGCEEQIWSASPDKKRINDERIKKKESGSVRRSVRAAAGGVLNGSRQREASESGDRRSAVRVNRGGVE
eukprot:GHVU01149123.1.p1 GENE.GHVU01149123.1~~GHVU01149123.1.p1  ORF type:complete len:174 (-),score=20.55 GHVU01149123.1:1882-2403(-)